MLKRQSLTQDTMTQLPIYLSTACEKPVALAHYADSHSSSFLYFCRRSNYLFFFVFHFLLILFIYFFYFYKYYFFVTNLKIKKNQIIVRIIFKWEIIIFILLELHVKSLSLILTFYFFHTKTQERSFPCFNYYNYLDICYVYMINLYFYIYDENLLLFIIIFHIRIYCFLHKECFCCDHIDANMYWWC